MDATAAAIILTPDAVISLMSIAKKLLDKRRIRRTDFKENLEAVKMDLGIIKDVVRAIDRRGRRSLSDGINNWRKEASSVVKDVDELLRRIKKKNPDHSDPDLDVEEDDGPETTSWCSWFGGNELRFNSQDANDLESLRTRLDNITKHNQTVLTLLNRSRCNPL